jgi:hypothetical protein
MDPKIIEMAESLSKKHSHKFTPQKKESDLDGETYPLTGETYPLTKENLSKFLKEDGFLPLTEGNLSRHNQKDPSQNVSIRNISASNVSRSCKSKVNDDGYCNIS